MSAKEPFDSPHWQFVVKAVAEGHDPVRVFLGHAAVAYMPNGDQVIVMASNPERVKRFLIGTVNVANHPDEWIYPMALMNQQSIKLQDEEL